MDYDIDRLLPTAQITLEEPPAEKDETIAFLLDLVVENDRVNDRENALEALRERERETTTGVGKGIAIPHAQTDGVSEPSVAFCRSEAGLDFDSMDEQPAHLIFEILVPEGGSDDHLEILSSLSRSLMHEEVREGLYDAENAEEIQEVIREAISS